MEKKLLAIKRKFNELPSPVRVIAYSGLATILVQLGNDIEYIPEFYRNYAGIFIGIGGNLLAYLILHEKKEDN